MTDTARTGPKLWMALLLAGALMIAVTLFLTVRQFAAGNNAKCALPAKGPQGDAVLAVPDGVFRLGEGVCIGIKSATLYKTALAQPVTADTPHRIRELKVYFDGKPTPAIMTLDLDAPRPAQGAWTDWHWVDVELRPMAIADTPAAKSWRELVAATGPAWRPSP